MLTRTSILEQAARCVTTDRATTHGDVEELFTQIAAVWSCRTGVTITPAQVALMMIDLKVCRAWNNPRHDDNWIDIAGYAACGGEVVSKTP